MDNKSQRSYISNISNNYSNITCFSDDDSQIDIVAAEQQLNANNRIMGILHNALQDLSQKDFKNALNSLDHCLPLLQHQNENIKLTNYYISLIYCNKALCFFYLNDLAECENNLNLASEALELTKNIKIENYRVLYLKILCNYCVLYTKTKELENVEQIVDLMIQFIKKEKDNKNKF